GLRTYGLQEYAQACRLTALSEIAVPKDAHELRSLIGLLSWYSKFIPNFSTIVEPLRSLTRTESSALSIFDPTLPTILTIDASDVGIRAVLSQRYPHWSERTVAFASRMLSPTERTYSIVEREALACVWAVERWRCWLRGISFELCTDYIAY
ncbi:hypothetical protein M514_19602, partial [Trichuris suis]